MIDSVVGDDNGLTRLDGMILAGAGECEYGALAGAVEVVDTLSLPFVGSALPALRRGEDQAVEILDAVAVVHDLKICVADIALLAACIVDGLEDQRALLYEGHGDGDRSGIAEYVGALYARGESVGGDIALEAEAVGALREPESVDAGGVVGQGVGLAERVVDSRELQILEVAQVELVAQVDADRHVLLSRCVIVIGAARREGKARAYDKRRKKNFAECFFHCFWFCWFILSLEFQFELRAEVGIGVELLHEHRVVIGVIFLDA